MIQKWYNRILWTSGSIALLGLLIVFPILMSFEMGVTVLNAIGIIVPICGIIFVSFIFGDIFFDCRHYSAWINHRYEESLDRSE